MLAAPELGYSSFRLLVPAVDAVQQALKGNCSGVWVNYFIDVFSVWDPCTSQYATCPTIVHANGFPNVGQLILTNP
jgi:hypothetical protein